AAQADRGHPRLPRRRQARPGELIGLGIGVMFLDGFIVLLRDYGVPVSLTDSIDFYRGMERGLAPDLGSLFVFARLCFVRRVEHMDAYERAFALHFYGVDIPRVAE